MIFTQTFLWSEKQLPKDGTSLYLTELFTILEPLNPAFFKFYFSQETWFDGF